MAVNETEVDKTIVNMVGLMNEDAMSKLTSIVNASLQSNNFAFPLSLLDSYGRAIGILDTSVLYARIAEYVEKRFAKDKEDKTSEAYKILEHCRQRVDELKK